MKIDKYYNAILTVSEGRQVLLNGRDITGVYLDDVEEIKRFCANSERVVGEKLDIYAQPPSTLSTAEVHSKRTAQWNIPSEYQELDVKQYLLDKCLTNEEEQRVLLEYKMFEDRELIPLLQLLIYLVDYMRKKKVVWGVGRGSSVASYALYLIGVHKVNSLQYNLPIEEFLK